MHLNLNASEHLSRACVFCLGAPHLEFCTHAPNPNNVNPNPFIGPAVQPAVVPPRPKTLSQQRMRIDSLIRGGGPGGGPGIALLTVPYTYGVAANDWIHVPITSMSAGVLVAPPGEKEFYVQYNAQESVVVLEKSSRGKDNSPHTAPFRANIVVPFRDAALPHTTTTAVIPTILMPPNISYEFADMAFGRDSAAHINWNGNNNGLVKHLIVGPEIAWFYGGPAKDGWEHRLSLRFDRMASLEFLMLDVSHYRTQGLPIKESSKQIKKLFGSIQQQLVRSGNIGLKTLIVVGLHMGARDRDLRSLRMRNAVTLARTTSANLGHDPDNSLVVQLFEALGEAEQAYKTAIAAGAEALMAGPPPPGQAAWTQAMAETQVDGQLLANPPPRAATNALLAALDQMPLRLKAVVIPNNTAAIQVVHDQLLLPHQAVPATIYGGLINSIASVTSSFIQRYRQCANGLYPAAVLPAQQPGYLTLVTRWLKIMLRILAAAIAAVPSRAIGITMARMAMPILVSVLHMVAPGDLQRAIRSVRLHPTEPNASHFMPVNHLWTQPMIETALMRPDGKDINWFRILAPMVRPALGRVVIADRDSPFFHRPFGGGANPDQYIEPSWGPSARFTGPQVASVPSRYGRAQVWRNPVAAPARGWNVPASWPSLIRGQL